MTQPEAPAGARLIELHRRTGPSMWTIVDEADYEDLSRFHWVAAPRRHTTYACRAVRRVDGRRSVEYLHRYLIPAPECVDHRDGDGLNNRRENLRATTTAENARNRRGVPSSNVSGWLGVCWHKGRGKWHARVTHPALASPHVGYFTTPVAAAIARDLAALELDPVHFTLNFPGLRRPLPIIPR